MTDRDSEKAKIRSFLRSFKKAMRESGLYIYENEKNTRALLDLNYDTKDLIEVLKSINVLDYESGPAPDRNKPGDKIWVFGKEVEGKEFYIKIKIEETALGDKATCLSFHPSEFPVKYKFRDESE